MAIMATVDVKEIPGGLFTTEHWNKIACDLLAVVMEAYPGDLWRGRVKPRTKMWADEYLEFEKKHARLAKERALAKLTHDDKVALGLEG